MHEENAHAVKMPSPLICTISATSATKSFGFCVPPEQAGGVIFHALLAHRKGACFPCVWTGSGQITFIKSMWGPHYVGC
jgi:hypothetical protein